MKREINVFEKKNINMCQLSYIEFFCGEMTDLSKCLISLTSSYVQLMSVNMLLV